MELKLVKVGIPQGSILRPILFYIYINDVPTLLYSETVTFADDIAITAVEYSVEISTEMLQSDLNKITIPTWKWRTKLNESEYHNL